MIYIICNISPLVFRIQLWNRYYATVTTGQVRNPRGHRISPLGRFPSASALLRVGSGCCPSSWHESHAFTRVMNSTSASEHPSPATAGLGPRDMSVNRLSRALSSKGRAKPQAAFQYPRDPVKDCLGTCSVHSAPADLE